MKTFFRPKLRCLPVFSPAWYRTAFILLLGLFVTFFSQAQNKLWDKTLGGNEEDDFKIVHQTKDGGYILGGWSWSGKNGDKTEANRDTSTISLTGDYWIVKLKADGSKEWDKTLGGNNNDQLTSLQPTSDGGYILGGSSISGKSGDKS